MVKLNNSHKSEIDESLRKVRTEVTRDMENKKANLQKYLSQQLLETKNNGTQALEQKEEELEFLKKKKDEELDLVKKKKDQELDLVKKKKDQELDQVKEKFEKQQKESSDQITALEIEMRNDFERIAKEHKATRLEFKRKVSEERARKIKMLKMEHDADKNRLNSQLELIQKEKTEKVTNLQKLIQVLKKESANEID